METIKNLERTKINTKIIGIAVGILLIGLSLFAVLVTDVSAKSSISEGKDHNPKNSSDMICVNKETNISTPPDLPIGKKAKKVKSLCPEGQVPKSLISMPGKKLLPPTNITVQNVSTVKPYVTCEYGACYDWAQSSQYVGGVTGVSAFLSQHNPYVSTADFHSLAEIAILNTSGINPGNVVEFGWTKNVGDITRLFTFWWLNSRPQCMNGCGWVQVSSGQYPGMPVSTNLYPTIIDDYAIEQYQGNWWIYYNGEWIGYYPGSLWNGNYVNGNLVQYFGEVALSLSNSLPTSTQMGNGYLPCISSFSPSAVIDNQEYLSRVGTWNFANTIKYAINDPQFYTLLETSPYSMTYGGPNKPGLICQIIHSTT